MSICVPALAAAYGMGDMGWGRRSAADEMVMMLPVLRSFNGPKTNAYRALVDPHKWTCGFISRADVADFLVKQIDDDAFLHKTPVLTS